MELWPSTPSAGGEQDYDDFVYAAMTNDKPRNDFFLRAFRQALGGKVVVDIGTGKDAILARLAIEAGARKVYAIELLERPAQQAAALVNKLGVAERIVVIQGDARLVELPEKADACICENLGHIGGAEGSDLILDYARRLVKAGGLFIPGRCTTLVAAVTMPEKFLRDPHFNELGAHYADQLFARAGYKYDLRLAATGVSRALLSSTEDVFEEIDFREPAIREYEREVRLTITRDSRIDGFVLWLKIEAVPGEVFETLANQGSWLPVYLPAFDPPIAVRAGDVIHATVRGTLAENAINRDYRIAGHVQRPDGQRSEFDYASHHYKALYRQTPFYQRLFRDEPGRGFHQAVTNQNQSSHDTKGLTNRTHRGELHSTLVTELFEDWRSSSRTIRTVNCVLRTLRIRAELRRLPNPSLEMTTVEQRINMYHLASQVLFCGVPGDFVELGCFTGQTAALFQKVIEHYDPMRILHVYDSFEYMARRIGNVEDVLIGNFRSAGVKLPKIHKGLFKDTIPRDLPVAIAFAHIDCGYGGDQELQKQRVLHCLKHVYARMSPGAICLLMDYHDPSLTIGGFDCNPGVKRACDEFFQDKPESVCVLYGNDYSHAYFRKMT